MKTCQVCGKLCPDNRFICHDSRCEKQWYDIGYDAYRYGTQREPA